MAGQVYVCSRAIAVDVRVVRTSSEAPPELIHCNERSGPARRRSASIAGGPGGRIRWPPKQRPILWAGWRAKARGRHPAPRAPPGERMERGRALAAPNSRPRCSQAHLGCAHCGSALRLTCRPCRHEASESRVRLQPPASQPRDPAATEAPPSHLRKVHHSMGGVRGSRMGLMGRRRWQSPMELQSCAAFLVDS
ncbi:hypothetical protein NDU88_001981 [Pleurodeles waltl]|uniref:Uncharacterized protein n=1 Tax=Pleurodeles waltl TaxID=8319 RepID=A0AAV7U8E4_PLEWA|nr:hypothetical protein NDU88_001981 [Pleurodeles waltl]